MVAHCLMVRAPRIRHRARPDSSLQSPAGLFTGLFISIGSFVTVRRSIMLKGLLLYHGTRRIPIVLYIYILAIRESIKRRETPSFGPVASKDQALEDKWRYC